MTSTYSSDEFRQRLHEISEPDHFTITLVPPIFEVFQFNRKPFCGSVTDNGFSLSANTRLYFTSYRVVGTYSALNDKTQVTVELTPRKLEYYITRLGPVFMMIFATSIFIANRYFRLPEIITVNLFCCLGFIYIPIDNYRGRRLLKRFIEEMKISYPTSKI